MFVSAVKKVANAMFPIFRYEQVGNQITVAAQGTGFFVNSNGIFVTVAHLLDGLSPHAKLVYWGKIPSEVRNPPADVKEIARNEANDIFVGKVDIGSTEYLRLSEKMPDIGRSACIAGYPLAKIVVNNQGLFDFRNVRRYIHPTFVLDYWTDPCRSATGVIRTHDGFLLRDFGLFGMSGGPVFDTSATVIGMQGSVTPPRVSEGGGGRKISVENALAIKSPLILDFLKQNRIRLN